MSRFPAYKNDQRSLSALFLIFYNKKEILKIVGAGLVNFAEIIAENRKRGLICGFGRLFQQADVIDIDMAPADADQVLFFKLVEGAGHCLA